MTDGLFDGGDELGRLLVGEVTPRIRLRLVAVSLPGTLLALIFSVYVYLSCVLNPSLAPRGTVASWPARLKALVHLLPPLFLFTLVVGSIYAGFATATEASALGVMGALGSRCGS